MSVDMGYSADSIRAKRHAAALSIIEQHAAMHLDEAQLVQYCVAKLIEAESNLKPTVAVEIALHALQAFQARTRPAHIDVTRSTSYVVHVVDGLTGRIYAFTASELLDVIEHKRRAANVHSCGRRADLN